MKNIELYRWIQGYMQLCPNDTWTLHKTYIVRNHVNLVVAVEGSLGEYNQELYRLSEAVVNATAEAAQKTALEKMLTYMKATYTGDNLR
jgi:hypothetical protein